MPEADVIANAAVQSDRRQAQPGATAVGLLQCLVVSADGKRRKLLAGAAQDGGWRTLVCEDNASASRCVTREFVQLAVVDLGGMSLEQYRPLLVQLAPMAQLLLVVCGNENNVPEEIAVRQLGVWMYLPGVDDADGITLLCSEARHLAERLSLLNDSPTGSASLPRSATRSERA